MKPAMPRIPWARGMQSLHRAGSAPSCRAAMVARSISTTTPASSTKRTEWVRSKLWKDGEAPGAADPYTQRPDDIPEDSAVTTLPREALLDGSDPFDKRPQVVRNSRLPLPPQRSEAATPKELEAKDPTYEPATSIDDLEDVQVLSKWWDQPGHWSELDNFKGFGSVEKVTDKAAIEVYLRRALVEVIALQETGALGEWATQKWAEGSREQLDATLAVEIVAQEGTAVLKGEVAAVADSVKQQSESETDVVARPERLSGAEAAEMIKAWDASWKEITLNDETKFALRKRLYQLTGNLIPDAKLGAAHTIKHLITLTAKQPKSQRLAEILEKTDQLQQLSNVKVHDRKIGAIDKEVAIGRWKVIEEELRKRDLPIIGKDNMKRNKEREWLMGKK